MKKITFFIAAMCTFPAMGQLMMEQGNSTPSTASNTTTSNTYAPPQGDAKTLYGNEIPFLNPQDGTVTINGQQLNMGSFREIEARFNKYLAQPEETSEDAKEYEKIFTKLHDVLSMKKERITADNVLRQVVDLLTKASTNPLDGGVSDALCQSIYTAWQANSNGRGKSKMATTLEKEIKMAHQKLSLMESGVDNSAPASSGSNSQKASGDKGAKSTGDAIRDNPRYQYIKKRIVELEARKLKLEGEEILTTTEAKLTYQATLVQLFAQRRFDHVSIGCAVYSRIFKDGDTKLKLEKNSDAAKMFGGTLGVPPTVAVLDNLSREMIRDSRKHMQAVNHLVDSNHYVDALERLNEALLIGEFLIPVSTFSFEKKQKLYYFKRDVEKLFELMNGKDYEEALTLIQSLKKRANDLSTGRAESAISGAIFASDAYIAQGSEALAQGDRARLEECIKQAIQIWPKNPRLLPLRNAMMAAGQQSYALEDFKRFINEKEYRKIFDRQHEFAVLVKNDETMKAQFTEVLGKMRQIEEALGAARQRESMQDINGAWEELQKLNLKDPELFDNDRELNRLYRDLTTKASQLVRVLDDARKCEDSGEIGSALGRYMEAKRIYPYSTFAKDGIEKLLDQIMPR
ncbi:MAG: hypothetical protein Q4C05_06220 [Akkermansia sp.]|nr:hypothetical protein [Akkermansia sp.]